MTRSDLQQLPDGAFKAWAVRYDWDGNSFQAGPGELKKEQDKIYDTDGTDYRFDQTDYIDGLRIFHSDDYELVMFDDQKDFLKGLGLFSQLISKMTFDSPQSSSESDELDKILDGISMLGPLAEIATGGQITLDVASTKALTTPTEKWVIEMGEEPCTVHHAGTSSLVYGADTLASQASGHVYSEYEDEEGFVMWVNIHDQMMCVFEDEADFVKGLKFWKSMFAFDLGDTPPELKALLAEHS
jgi:hypothetical protein